MTSLSRLPAVLGGLGAVVVLGVGASLAVGGTDNPTNNVRAALDGSTPKNVIFLLGDGMGTQEITAARYYAVGAAGKLNVDRMPFTGFDKTWSVKPAASAPYLPDYDPDSASTGTEWATGRKTLDERVSQGPSSSISVPGENYKTILEDAQAAGKKVGNVSTAEITDATPAVLASHISLRGCQGPSNMGSCAQETKAAGGLGSIAEQEVDHKVDVLLGGGRGRFEQPITGGPDAGKTVVQSAQDKGFQYVTDASGLAAVTDKSKPLLGLFHASNMTTEYTQGTASTLGAGTTTTCNESNRPADEPSLSAMTTKALQLLENDKGFFLQVEGASIDKQDHATNACGQIGETVAFDNAIGVALDYQQTHPDTLVVVTADHAHTSQIVSEDATGSGLPTGYSTNVVTKDGQTLSLTYGTAGYGGVGSAPVTTPPSMQHTGSVVPVWGVGPQASAVLGTNDHTDLFDLLRGAKVAQTAPSTTTTVTQTVTGPTTTVSVPAKVGKPRVGLALGSGATRAGGIAISVAAVDAKTVTVTLKQGTKTIATKKLLSSGGSARLRAIKAKKGLVRITVTAKGTGGTTTKAASIRLKK
jgi:alkaline phosphatase/streptomycin-6-phosphatase